MPRCQGTTADGRPCAQQAKRGSEFCGQHGPGRQSRCRICRDSQKAEIEAMLMSGARPSAVAARFRLTPDMLWHHRRHLPLTGAGRAGGSTAGTDGGQR